MKKLAIFVEGQTEQVFVEKFISEIAGKNGVTIEKRKAFGGRKCKRKYILLADSAKTANSKFYVLIVDCGNDSKVKSDILERYEGLVNSGYESIVGIRDVFPEAKTPNEIKKLRNGLVLGVKTKPIKVIFVLAIMEIEAWFIGEHTHFEKVNRTITMDRIKRKLGFNPSKDNVEKRPHPSEDLNRIYQLGGKKYCKSAAIIQNTLNALDFAFIYIELPNAFQDLKALVEAFDRFFSGPKSTSV